MVKIAKVNAIKRKPNFRQIIDYDGNSYTLNLESLVLNKVKPEMEYSYENWQEILTSSDYQIGIDYSFDLLSRGMRTEKEIRDKLKIRNIINSAIDRIIDRLLELNYINDRKYAKEYINSYKSTRGSIRLRNELQLKGVERDIIEDELSTIDDEIETATKLSEDFVKGVMPEGKDREKLIRYLIRRGFSYDIIKSAITRLGGIIDDL